MKRLQYLPDIRKQAEKAELIPNRFSDGEVYNVWCRINPAYDHRTNIRIGEESTGRRYRGIAIADTRFMVFE